MSVASEITALVRSANYKIITHLLFLHHSHHPSLYVSYCWAQASSQNKRAFWDVFHPKIDRLISFSDLYLSHINWRAVSEVSDQVTDPLQLH